MEEKGEVCMIKEKLMIRNYVSCQIERGSPMMRVLICDDDLLFLNSLHAEIEVALHDAGIKAKVHAYSSGEEIGDPILASCDIAFLDIDFAKKKYTGIDIAKKIRLLRKDTIIIFVTNYIEYAPEGYEVSAFRYLLKSELPKKLKTCLNLAIAHLHSVRETMKIQVNGEIIDIFLNDILYFESQQHTVLLYAKRDAVGRQIKQYRFYSSLSDIEKQLEPHGFLRVHKSYLVNMGHIKKYQCHEATLANGTVLRVSEKNYAQQKEKYLLWKGK